MPYKSDDLINELRKAREAAGLSQRALSARSGLTQSHISNIERRTLEPGLSSLIDVARALDLELVLVPKRLLPAVTGILHTERVEHDLSPESGKSALGAIARAERIVAKQKSLYGSSIDLDQILESLRFLRHAPLQSPDIDRVKNAANALNRYQSSAQSNSIVKEVATQFRELRNRYAHPVSNAPRPAYTLADGGDDA